MGGAKTPRRNYETQPVAVFYLRYAATDDNKLDRSIESTCKSRRDHGSNGRPMPALTRLTKPANAGEATLVLNRCLRPAASRSHVFGQRWSRSCSTPSPHQRHLACVSGLTVSYKLLLERLEGLHRARALRTTDTHTVRHIGSRPPVRRCGAEAKSGRWVLFGLITVILIHTIDTHHATKNGLLWPERRLVSSASVLGSAHRRFLGRNENVEGTGTKGTRRDIGRDAGSSIMGYRRRARNR